MPELAEGWTLTRSGDAALVLECEQRIDPDLNARVIAVAKSIRSRERPGVRDVVESYCAIAVHFDPLKTDVEGLVQDLPDDTRWEARTASLCLARVGIRFRFATAASTGQTSTRLHRLRSATSRR